MWDRDRKEEIKTWKEKAEIVQQNAMDKFWLKKNWRLTRIGKSIRPLWKSE